MTCGHCFGGTGNGRVNRDMYLQKKDDTIKDLKSKKKNGGDAIANTGDWVCSHGSHTVFFCRGNTSKPPSLFFGHPPSPLLRPYITSQQ